MDRTGQIKISETIAVLFIFFVLILFGIIFYYKYQQAAFFEKEEELLGAKAIEITLKTLFLPELICSKGAAEPEDNCFDVLKLDSVDKTFRKYADDYYFDLFSYATISVKEVYPGDSSWLLYDKPPLKINRKEPTFFVVSLRDDLTDENKPQYRLGYVEVVAYS
ncbi:MAG: hypothetical protein AABW48_05625 [Nanoarchaeota archaeon]